MVLFGFLLIFDTFSAVWENVTFLGGSILGEKMRGSIFGGVNGRAAERGLENRFSTVPCRKAATRTLPPSRRAAAAERC